MAATTYRAYALALLGIAALASCGKKEEPRTPSYPVYLTAKLQTERYRPLLSPVATVAVTSPSTQQEALGYGGILLVHGWHQGQYFAYDLSCPNENKTDIRITADSHEARCATCGTTYDIFGGQGNPLDGIGNTGLRRYRVDYNPTLQTLSVSN